MKNNPRFLSRCLRCIAVLTLFCPLLLPQKAGAAECSADMRLRVGLYFQDASADSSVPALKNSSLYGFEFGLYDEETDLFTTLFSTGAQDISVFSENGNVCVAALPPDESGDHSPVSLLYSSQSMLHIRPLGASLITIAGIQYGGIMEYSIAPSGKLGLIHIIPLEEYVKGVLPAEFIASWEDEALKAGAVAIRTFALSSLGKHTQGGFDLCASTHCQVYRGRNGATERTDAAVDMTAGEVVTYGGALALTVYHSSSIDATENVSGAWGSVQSQYPYLSSVKTAFTDSSQIPGSLWSAAILPHELTAYLSGKSMYNGKLTGEIAEISYQTGESGYVNQMTVTDIKGNSISAKTSGEVRSLLSNYIRSACFYLAETYLYSDTAADRVPPVLTASGIQEVPERDELAVLTADGGRKAGGAQKVYFIKGKGYGHGIGMSQYGAQQLALLGSTYDQILQTFYSGTDIERLP